MIELAPDDFPSLLPWLEHVPFNTLFARSVIERAVEGQVRVDRRHAPAVAHIIHPYGMSLLLVQDDIDDPGDVAGYVAEHCRVGRELWMQVHPQRLAFQLDRLFDIDPTPEANASDAPRVRRYTRTNFRFDASRHLAARRTAPPLPAGIELRAMHAAEFAMPDVSVSPARFWNDAWQFLAQGGGWCTIQDGEVTAIAFTSFRRNAQLEIGVETRLRYRGHGHARHAACALIDACLASGLEPVWSCRRENVASFRLAGSLGFDPVFDGAYYHLPANA